MAGEALSREDAVVARFKTKAPPKPKANGISEDADHFLLARAFLDATTARTGTQPVFALGKVWCVVDGLWVASSLDTVAVDIGKSFGGYRYCRRGSDFNSIGRIFAGIVTDDNFFDAAPIGIAAGSNFWRIGRGGIRPEPLEPAHRQRMRLLVDPDFQGEAPLWGKLLGDAFRGDPAQQDLLQTLFGAALAHDLWRHRIAVLLLGKTTTGKSTLLNVLAHMFPRDQVAATGPHRWDNEYYLAGLAGKALNIVGELDAHTPIPGGAFKSVVGCDIIEGRHPSHRPFSFVCTAAHVFNANKTPPTMDRSDAFFKRWRIVEFTNVVPDDEIIEGLSERIIEEELPVVLAWMLEGANMLQATGSVPETAQHKRLLSKWRAANNSALSFLLDSSACELDPGANVLGADLYRTYTEWAMHNGAKAFGRNGFYEAIEEGAGRHGVRRVEHAGVVHIAGVRRA